MSSDNCETSSRRGRGEARLSPLDFLVTVVTMLEMGYYYDYQSTLVEVNDGDVRLVVDCCLEKLSPDQARQLAQALLQAANEIEPVTYENPIICPHCGL